MGRRCYVLLRRRNEVPIRCRGNMSLRRLGDVPPRRRWVVHLRFTYDVAGTYKELSLRRLLPAGNLRTLPNGKMVKKNANDANDRINTTNVD